MRRKALRFGVLVLAGVIALAGGAALYGWAQLRPTAPGEEFLVRYDPGRPLRSVLDDLQTRGVVRDARLWTVYAQLKGRGGRIPAGTYRFRPGMTAGEVLESLRRPITQRVRVPEGWWIARVARLLEEKGVCPAEEYVRMAHSPELFAQTVSFPLPESSLEGYLFPDTYELPPLLGARGVIERQLRTFERRVLGILPPGADLHRTVVVASMVELEVALDRERPLVAGVIENRLRRGMPLQIDATVLYALQDWRELPPGFVRTVESPYNTYLYDGLPPGPIGSPGLASLRAALKPARHDWLYYVALPDRSHLFARTYEEHRANIRRRKEALERRRP